MNNTVSNLFNGLKNDIEKRLSTPYRYILSAKYNTSSKTYFTSESDAIAHAKEFLNNYYEGGIESCELENNTDLYIREFVNYGDWRCQKHQQSQYEIKGVKNNHEIIFTLRVYNYTEPLQKELDDLVKSYNDFINYNNEELKKYNLINYIPFKNLHTASYSFASSSLGFINKDNFDVQYVNYDWQDYEYSDASMRDTHDYTIEGMKKDINKFAFMLNDYVNLINRVNKNDLCKGAIVEVVKGRKVPKGTTGIIKDFQDITDCYKRYHGQYAIFEDGTKTNKNNLKLLGYVNHEELARFI